MFANKNDRYKKAYDVAYNIAYEKAHQLGMELAKFNVAMRMLLYNEDMEKIIKYTSLSKDEIEKLSADLQI